jgi:hypothetical protein
MTENEKSSIDNDMRLLPVMVEAVKSEDRKVYELALKQIMIMCENNPK